MPGSAVIRYPPSAAGWTRRRTWRLPTPGRGWAPGPGYILKFGVVLAGYCAAAQVGFLLQFAGPVAAFVWLPAGTGITLLYLLGPQLWPAVVVGDLLVNDYATLPVGAGIGQSFGNLLEVLLAAILLRRLAAGGMPLGSSVGVSKVVVVLIAATALSATVGLASLLLGHVVTLAAIPRLWRTWWLGDLCGSLLLVPLAIAWKPPPARLRFDRHMAEAAAVMLALLGLITLAWRANLPLYYALFALIWAAVRFGPRGAALSISIGGAFTIWTTKHYLGPFTYHSIDHRLLNVQVYVALSAAVTLAVAALVDERRRLTAELHDSRVRTVAVADEERARIAHNIHDGAQQQLIAIVAQLSLAADQARTDPAGAPLAIERVEAEVELAIEELRELAHGIQPPSLRRFGLGSAIRQAAARSARSATTITVDLDGLPKERLDDAVEATAYYVVLEALTNAHRHAQASAVNIRAGLNRVELVLEVADDGVGGAAENDGFGIRGLQDRVEAVGGSFLIRSDAGLGTVVAARIPVCSRPTR